MEQQNTNGPRRVKELDQLQKQFEKVCGSRKTRKEQELRPEKANKPMATR